MEPEKPKTVKKKKDEKKVFSYYKLDEESLTRLRPFCERCGPGYFMGDHGNRHTCGNCGFTRYKQSQE
ncbi:MAG: 30S ribosomal protein S27ae [Candidatus Bathyarchaeota archaeon]|nr:MAG: 30S ribosomal protein S27ae [Candidatus Bathyarchaeota archaeon]